MMVGHVDAAGLAVAFAEAAAVALILVKHRTVEREMADIAQYGAHGADGVAVGAAVAPGQDADNQQRHSCHGNGDGGAHPNVDRIEGVALVVLGNGGQAVVGPQVEGLHQVGGDAPVGTVGGNQDGQTVEPGNHEHEEEQQHQAAQHATRWRIGIFVGQLGLLAAEQLALAQPGYDVLHDAQGADDGAVDAPQEQGEQHQGDHDGDVQRQDGGQELSLGHPTEIVAGRAGEVEEQERQAEPEDYGQHASQRCQEATGFVFVLACHSLFDENFLAVDDVEAA